MSDAPCQAKWITEEELVEGCDCAVGLDSAVQTQLVTAASQIIYILLGRSLTGQCEATVRPVMEPQGWHNWRAAHHDYFPYDSGLYPDAWTDAIPLQFPVIEVTEVKIDGATLDPSKYAVMDEQYLVRLDDGSSRSWPASNDLSKASTQAGTWEVSYTFGYAISEDIKMAVLEIAADMAKAIAGRATALPASATSVTRGGVNLNLQRVVDAVKEAGSSLPQVAKIIALYNPDEARMPPFVWSPEVGTSLHSF